MIVQIAFFKGTLPGRPPPACSVGSTWPPRPKLMPTSPPSSSGGQWVQAWLWMPFPPFAPPATTFGSMGPPPRAAGRRRADNSSSEEQDEETVEVEEEAPPAPKPEAALKRPAKDYQWSAKGGGVRPTSPVRPPSTNPGGTSSSHLGPAAGPFPGGGGAAFPPLRPGTPEAAAMAAFLQHLLAVAPIPPPPAPRDPGIMVPNHVHLYGSKSFFPN